MEVRFTSIPQATVERIAKLLTRLGDDNQYEILAACGAIVATLNGAGHDLDDLAKLVRLGGRITVGQLLGQIQVSVKNAQRQQSERQRMRRAAAKTAAQADPAAQADRIRKSVEIWSKKVAILRTQNWFDAEQRQFVAQISAQLAGGEPLTAEQRNRVQSLLMKSQIREQKRTSAETEGPAPKAGSHWAS